MQNTYDSRRLYFYIITRFLIVLTVVVAAELAVSKFAEYVLFPTLIDAGDTGSGDAGISLSFYGILQLLGAILTGQGRSYIRQALPQAEAAGLLLFILFLFLLPVVIGIFVYAHLISEKIQQLARQREEEHRIYDQKRNLLISDMAHDLRTPMTTVAGYAQALADGVVPQEKQQEYLRAIIGKTERMSDMITELFTYARLGSEGFQLYRQTFDLRELLLRTAADLYTDMEQAGMHFEVDIPDDEIPVDGDAAHISRVFTNLLVNAMRHNPKGTRILLLVRRQAGTVQAAVIDDGVTIPQNVDIFDPFVKADISRSNSSGSGLGLSIARTIIEMHGWQLTLQQPYPAYTKAFVVQAPVVQQP